MITYEVSLETNGAIEVIAVITCENDNIASILAEDIYFYYVNRNEKSSIKLVRLYKEEIISLP